MKKTLSFLCIMTLLAMSMVACEDALVDELDQKNSATTTRSADADAAQTSGCTTVTFYDQNVTTNRTVQGCEVETKNITVSNGAKLTIIGSKKVTTLANLKVNSGCKFEIRSE
ncbi:hypothetical protein [uncultured Alistipes sp.]|uniref:hypothetical protein n=1 Tax=uncultured Alistipes sp. TaxID=538949 RepID=UPI00262300BD|nr:hypothetical protein [uncultured Alistipes sp.]